MKKILPLLVLAAVILTGCAKKTAPAGPAPAQKTEAINQVAVKDRPFVSLSPRADGKELTITVDRAKNAAKAEYEVEYNTSTIISGFFGTIDFNQESQPVVKKGLFGTCSKNVCRYDEGVSGGSLTLTFSGGDKPYVLKSDFNLQQMFDREGVFVSKDAKATLDVGKAGLPNNTFIIVSGTMGLPQDIDGQILAGPYSFLAATSPVLKSATVSIQFKDDLSGAKLVFWDGKALIELNSAVSNGALSAPVTALGTFVVVK